jgi:hypothetical protein
LTNNRATKSSATFVADQKQPTMHTLFMTIYVLCWTLWHTIFPEIEEQKKPEPRREMTDADTGWHTENYFKALQERNAVNS